MLILHFFPILNMDVSIFMRTYYDYIIQYIQFTPTKEHVEIIGSATSVDAKIFVESVL